MKGFGREPTPADTNVVVRRVVAQAIDVGLMLGVYAVLWFGGGFLGLAVDTATGNEEVFGPIFAGTGFFLGTAVWVGYPFVLEAVWDGKTVGKRLAGIKAVTERGDPIDPVSALVRNVPAPLAFNWVAYLVAFFSMAESDTKQRLFDRFAGTVVVRDPEG